MRTRNNDKKGEKEGEGNDQDGTSTKGYQPNDLRAMIQGLTKSIENLDKKIDNLNQDKIDLDELNCAKL